MRGGGAEIFSTPFAARVSFKNWRKKKNTEQNRRRRQRTYTNNDDVYLENIPFSLGFDNRSEILGPMY